MHALLDEGKVESSFGEWVKASSYENPDVKEYAQRKPALMRHALNRLGRPPFDLHESRNLPERRGIQSFTPLCLPEDHQQLVPRASPVMTQYL